MTPLTELASTVLLESSTQQVVIVAFRGPHVQVAHVGLRAGDEEGARRLALEIAARLKTGALTWPNTEAES